MKTINGPSVGDHGRGNSPERIEAGPGFVGEVFHHLKVSVIATIVLAIIVSAIYPAVVWGLAQALFHNKANGSLIGKDGQPVNTDQDAVGSALIGQNFSDAKYFHPRPSSAGNGYDATASGGSNLGPTSAKLIYGTTKPTTLPATQPGADPLPGPDAVDFDGVSDRIVHYCVDNHIPFESSIELDGFKDKDGNLDDVKLIKAFNADTPFVFTPRHPIPADAVTASGSGLDPHISLANAQLQAKRVADARKMPVDKVAELIAQFTDAPQLGIFGDAGVNVLRLNLALDHVAPVAAVAPRKFTVPHLPHHIGGISEPGRVGPVGPKVRFPARPTSPRPDRGDTFSDQVIRRMPTSARRSSTPYPGTASSSDTARRPGEY